MVSTPIKFSVENLIGNIALETNRKQAFSRLRAIPPTINPLAGLIWGRTPVGNYSLSFYRSSGFVRVGTRGLRNV